MNNKANKKIKNASKVIYDGIEFRSKLEVYCYKKLKEEGIEFKYESYTYNLVPTFKYKFKMYEPYKKDGSKWILTEKTNLIRGMSYTPDFVNEEEHWIIECKGQANDALTKNIIFFVTF